MTGVVALGHVGIAARDLGLQLDFYTPVLGLTITDGAGSRRAGGQPRRVGVAYGRGLSQPHDAAIDLALSNDEIEAIVRAMPPQRSSMAHLYGIDAGKRLSP